MILEKTCPLLLAVFFASICLASSAVKAETLVPLSPEPQIVGNTITVNDDGWYQFQDAMNFSEVCAGTLECNVPDGRYIVINHTNGQRWENIEVITDSVNFLTITGSNLSFPDNGWYQVQDSTAYASACNGLTSCSVADGTYNIINHTTGQRWNSVPISHADNTPQPNVLLLPDDGWYQVQDGDSFDSVCEGILRCAVQDGTYIVINHTSGQRYEGLRIGSGELEVEQQPPSAVTFTSANAASIFRHVVSVINEDEIDAFFENAQNDMNFQGRTFFLSNTVEDIQFAQGVDLDTPYQLETNFGVGEFTEIPVRAEYTCAAGGSIYNYDRDRVFDNCSVGENTYNGTAGRRNDNLRGTIRSYPFWNFSATGSSGSRSELTGGYSFGNVSFVVLNQTSRWVDAEYYTQLGDGEFRIGDFNIERLDKSDLGFTLGNITVSTQSGTPVEILNNSQSSSIEGSFTVQADWTQQDELTVTVSLAFQDTIRVLVDDTIENFPGMLDPQEPFEWQTGSVTVSTQEGELMTIVPTVPADQSFSIFLSNGETVGPLSWSDGYTIDCGSLEICGD